jgi:hypothetical protein
VDYDGYKAGGRKRFRAYRPEPGTRYRVVILSRKEPKDGGDALAVLGVVEVVAPPVEGSVNIRVVAWRVCCARTWMWCTWSSQMCSSPATLT